MPSFCYCYFLNNKGCRKTHFFKNRGPPSWSIISPWPSLTPLPLAFPRTHFYLVTFSLECFLLSPSSLSSLIITSYTSTPFSSVNSVVVLSKHSLWIISINASQSSHQMGYHYHRPRCTDEETEAEDVIKVTSSEKVQLGLTMATKYGWDRWRLILDPWRQEKAAGVSQSHREECQYFFQSPWCQEWPGGTSLAVQWWRLCASTAGAMGLVPVRESKLLHATQPKKKKKERQREKISWTE